MFDLPSLSLSGSLWYLILLLLVMARLAIGRKSGKRPMLGSLRRPQALLASHAIVHHVATMVRLRSAYSTFACPVGCPL